MDTEAEHWDSVYGTKASDEVSWYQPDAGVSLDLIAKHGKPGPIVDVGAGASVLVDELLESGWDDVTLLDVSTEGLDETRGRLSDRASAVTFVVADLLAWEPARRYATWHDRAVFHFLVDEVARDSYVRIAAAAIEPGGVLVVGTFAEDGPEQCSGLPTARYDSQTLAGLFAADFDLVATLRHVHRTPWASEQPFTWVVLRRQA